LLTDPLSVTYNGSAKSLPRTSASKNGTVYRTADGEFEVSISNFPVRRDGIQVREISLTRRIPDPTPSDAFDAYRPIKNSFKLSYGFDLTRAEASVDIPLLRTALLNFVDSTMQNRVISGEM
jgi:hypothetical protein